MGNIQGWVVGLQAVLLVMPFISFAEEPSPAENLATADLSEIDRRLNNPLTDLWSLTFQNNTAVNQGEAVDGSEISNNLLFQPFMPVAIGSRDQVMLTLRPVFPLVTTPVFTSASPRNSTGYRTGLGDIQLLTMAGPNQGEGVLWGLGATLVFPTATHRLLGQGKYQAGPAAMFFHMGKPWILGVLAQHWISYAGSEYRPDVKRTDIQYIIRRSIPGAMSIGMGPTVTIDWEKEPDNRLTLPVGLGLSKTVRWNSTPIKLGIETHYSLIKPVDYGTAWNFRLQVTPVLKSPFN